MFELPSEPIELKYECKDCSHPFDFSRNIRFMDLEDCVCPSCESKNIQRSWA